jgi:hypothetical protein
MNADDKNNVVEFWCRIPVPLQEVFDKFASEFSVGDYIRDYENVWEWFDGRTADDTIGFNISRQHDWGGIYSE